MLFSDHTGLPGPFLHQHMSRHVNTRVAMIPVGRVIFIKRNHPPDLYEPTKTNQMLNSHPRKIAISRTKMQLDVGNFRFASVTHTQV